MQNCCAVSRIISVYTGIPVPSRIWSPIWIWAAILHWGRIFRRHVALQQIDGCFVDFQRKKKKQKRSLYQRMLQEIPVERLFIETDGISAVAWTMGEAEAEWNMLPFALQANMQSLAEATGKNEAELQQQLCRNLGRFLQG